MLYYLFHYLDSLSVPGAGVFDYISFRAAMAIITSLLISMVFGKRIINLLRKQQIGETVRDLGLEGQKAKEGTPTTKLQLTSFRSVRSLTSVAWSFTLAWPCPSIVTL